MARLSALIVRISASGPGFALVLAVAAGALFGLLLPIGAAIAALTGGLPPFDLQNSLEAGQVFAELPAWPPAAFRLYYAFAAVDFVFPLAAGLAVAAVAAFGLRRLSPRAFGGAQRRSLFALLLAGTVFDWLENLGALAVVTAWPTELEPAAVLLVAAKRAKLAAVTAQNVVAGGLLLAGLAASGARAWTRRRDRERAGMIDKENGA